MIECDYNVLFVDRNSDEKLKFIPKILIFAPNFDLWSKFWFLRKFAVVKCDFFSIFGHFEFSRNFDKIPTLVKNFYLWPKFRSLN